jgi:HEAT repeat protein
MSFASICELFHKRLLVGKCPWCGSVVVGGQVVGMAPRWLRTELDRLLPDFDALEHDNSADQGEEPFSTEALLAIIGRCDLNANKAIPLLHLALRDTDEAVREAAANALGRIGPDARQALPTLSLLLKDECELVRDAAEAAITKIGDERRR